jgi:hypothetical protein
MLIGVDPRTLVLEAYMLSFVQDRLTLVTAFSFSPFKITKMKLTSAPSLLLRSPSVFLPAPTKVQEYWFIRDGGHSVSVRMI